MAEKANKNCRKSIHEKQKDKKQCEKFVNK